MIKHNQDGAVSGVGISLVLCIVILIAAVAFGGWAFTSRQDFKDNTDQKVAAAVEIAKQQESTVKDNQFTEQEKNPLKTYQGPESYGSLSIQFPKTWSGVVDDSGSNSSALVNGYFYPNVVPSISNASSVFALRVQVLGQPYATVLKSLANLQQNRDKPTSITPYALPKLPNNIGVQVNGLLPNQKTGQMIVLPLRSQTVEIWTEGTQFTGDFNNIILANFTFAP